MKKLKFISLALVAAVAFAGCNNIAEADFSESAPAVNSDVIIGNEVIYGGSFSLGDTIIANSLI